MAALVETRELFVVYPSPTGGIAALRGLTLAVEERETCVVLGPSGSGKTTLMRILAGLERPSAGSVVVDGLDLVHASTGRLARHRSRTLGYADQHYWRALAGELTAEELVGVPLGLLSVEPRERRARARELLERVGLLDRATARPGSSRAANSSGSRYAPRSRTARGCSSPTSPPVSSTPRRRRASIRRFRCSSVRSVRLR